MNNFYENSIMAIEKSYSLNKRIKLLYLFHKNHDSFGLN
jgi:hypothetical protein